MEQFQKVQQLKSDIKFCKKQMDKLLALGTTHAKFYIKKEISPETREVAETYYLVTPLRRGKRRKIYVGGFNHQVQSAQLRIDRYNLLRIYGKRLEILKNELSIKGV